MTTEIGELFVGAYLELCLGCTLVDYNVRPLSGDRMNNYELDVIGLDPDNSHAYLCEVSTQIRGLPNEETLRIVSAKHDKQKEYVDKHLQSFETVTYMFWSPMVPIGVLTKKLLETTDLELVINGGYIQRFMELRELARTNSHDAGNAFFRVLQIVERLRD